VLSSVKSRIRCVSRKRKKSTQVMKKSVREKGIGNPLWMTGKMMYPRAEVIPRESDRGREY